MYKFRKSVRNFIFTVTIYINVNIRIIVINIVVRGLIFSFTFMHDIYINSLELYNSLFFFFLIDQYFRMDHTKTAH